MDKWLLLIQQFGIPVLFVVSGLGLGLYFERRVLKRLHGLAQLSIWKGDDLILHSLNGMVVIWFFLGGCYLASIALPPDGKLLALTHRILYAALLVSITFLVSRLSVGFIKLYNSREGTSPMLTSLFETIAKVLVMALGILITLQSIGVPIAPLLATLGVGSVSLGLALQGPLTNLISGINLITSKKVRPKDYIKLKTGEEGYVVDVELKYTVIREITDNVIVIPNSQLIASSFRNYALPKEQMLVPIKVGISYDSDLEKVEAITLAVAQETLQEVTGGVPEYQPFMRYQDFDYFSINFTVYLQINEFYDHLIITHEFIKRLYKRYQQEGIQIPFPIKSTYMDNPSRNSRNQSDSYTDIRLETDY